MMMSRAFDFSGKSSRVEYWVSSIILGILVCIPYGFMMYYPNSRWENIYWIIVIIHFIPSLSLSMRRIRDANFSPWWVILHPIPLFSMVLIPILCHKGE